MKRVMIVVLGALAYIGARFIPYRAISTACSEDPLVWSEEIAAFANAHRSVQRLLFVGSSSIRRWVDLAEHMAPSCHKSRFWWL